MRTSLLLLCIPGLLLASRPAAAQGTEDRQPPAPPPSAQPAPPPPPAASPETAQTPPQATVPEGGKATGRQTEPKAPPPEAAQPEPKEDKPTGLLAPSFAEDRYPGDGQGGMDVKLTAPGGSELFFAMHGYFRAPMRFARVKRDAGTKAEGEGDYNYRTPFLVDDDYYRSGFAYTPVNESDWNELYLSVGNRKLTATVGFMNTVFSDSSKATIDRQMGLAQGWLTYRFAPDTGALKTRIRIKAGSFWDRFGYIPKYDTYIFGRTHQMGGQLRLEFEHQGLTFWILDGVGTHTEQIESNQGLTMLHYAHAGVSYQRTVELGAYYLNASARDKRQLKEMTDAGTVVKGFDARVDSHWGSQLYGAVSFIEADKGEYMATALEVMHANGGRGLMENYFGSENSNHGTGKLTSIAFQYDFSLAQLLRKLSENNVNPIPWGGDVTASVFGLHTKVTSDQKTDNPETNRDGISKWKWGTEIGWRATDWIGASFRYDRVVLDTDDSANSFRILSPRVSLYTSFLTHEQIFLQYSSYKYNERVRLRKGEIPLEDIPDDNVIKLQAQITF